LPLKFLNSRLFEGEIAETLKNKVQVKVNPDSVTRGYQNTLPTKKPPKTAIAVKDGSI
jgi:hypothetical protein